MAPEPGGGPIGNGGKAPEGAFEGSAQGTLKPRYGLDDAHDGGEANKGAHKLRATAEEDRDEEPQDGGFD